MKALFLFTCVTLTCSAWAQKSPELDRAKALASQEECQRLVEWELLPDQNGLRTDCRTDHLHFLGESPLIPSTLPVRLGNYNLLHPGTDKTLFKDFTLTAELIHQEFDVMAAVELVDVLASPRELNEKLRPILAQKFAPLQQLRERISAQRAAIAALEELLARAQTSSERTTLQESLRTQQEEYQRLEATLTQKRELRRASEADVQKYSRPNRSFLGFELGRGTRLRNLALAQRKLAELTAELQTLEAEMQQRAGLIAELERRLMELPETPTTSLADRERLEGLRTELDRNLTQLEEQTREFRRTSRFYRLPGYLRLLEELRRLDASWSLVLSPFGDAAVETNTQELVGFYYRSSRLALTRNQHCSSQYQRDSAACYPNFYSDYMGENFATIFSRRPFLATFTSGTGEFSMLASHVVFEPPTDPEKQKELLRKAFGVEELRQLPTGINRQNFARFAEVQVSLQLVNKLRDEGVAPVIYTGDLNLEAKNPFWNSTVFQRTPGMKLLIDEATSLSEPRFVQGRESRGVSSNYDHFILGEAFESRCQNAQVVNFIENDFSNRIREKYLVRAEAPRGPYGMLPEGETLIARRTSEVQRVLNRFNVNVRGGLITDDGKTTDADLKNFRERVFDSQLSDETFYKFFVQVMSDHLPIKLECQF